MCIFSIRKVGMKKNIKYQYAENSTGKVVDINTINKDCNNEKYLCISCKQELIPKLGEIRIHHFAHKNDTFNCSKETYLHELGKRVFYEVYLQCKNDNEPFYIVTSLINSLSITCKYNVIIKSKSCVKNGIHKYDLLSSFKNIEYEKNQDNFRPDLTLINNYGNKIFIEIAVTHPCEKEKIESKNKIIEIRIKNETDIQMILGKKISEENDLIKYYNFEDFNILDEPFCEDNTVYTYSVIYKNGNQSSGKTFKKEYCKYVYENIDKIQSIKLFKPIKRVNPIPFGFIINPNTYNRGPKINTIEAKYNNFRYKKSNNRSSKKWK